VLCRAKLGTENGRKEENFSEFYLLLHTDPSLFTIAHCLLTGFSTKEAGFPLASLIGNRAANLLFFFAL
jgi:hypothetical protein